MNKRPVQLARGCLGMWEADGAQDAKSLENITCKKLGAFSLLSYREFVK